MSIPSPLCGPKLRSRFLKVFRVFVNEFLTQDTSHIGSLRSGCKDQSQVGEYLPVGESPAESQSGNFTPRHSCGKDPPWKSPKSGLSHRSWKSRKQRGIPTFPQLDDGCYPVTSLMA